MEVAPKIRTGTVVTLLWGEFLRDALSQGFPLLANLDAVLPALILSIFALVIVSLFTGQTTAER